MQALKEWVRGIVILTVFAGAVDMVLPAGDLRKYARLALGLLIVLSIISPLAGMTRAGTWSTFAGGNALFPRGPGAAEPGDMDDKTRQVLEWQAEALAGAVPGVRSAKVTVRMRQPGEWPMPLGAAGIERVTVRVVTGGAATPGSGGPAPSVEPVPPVIPAGSRGTPAHGAQGRATDAETRKVADAIRSVICERFGLGEDAVLVEIAG
ncbi:MAG: stage III sporulation protein AF [Firmicutes bacterium]|nr:stage III sporulation protein AF [Bacillota bacterium]